VGIPSISSDISVIQPDDIAETFGFGKEKIRSENGPVDVLVGIDHPKLHTGETRESGNLVARQSPLGWVVFGEMSESCDVSQVFNVKSSKPIDSRLTKMHAKALTCFNFFNFHPFSTKFRIDIEHVILTNRMFFVFRIATFWQENDVTNLMLKN
jgi:hypothetical protein